MRFIDLDAQYHAYQGAIDDRLRAVFSHGRFIMGPEIDEIESALSAYVGVRHAITAASGTDALEIALRALSVGPGDEVITTPFTWISPAEVIVRVGARPVFVDIDPQSFNLDVDRIEAAVTPRTRAIIAVSLFGRMPDYDRINALAERHGLAVIEDGAQSFGATWRGRRSGGVTRIGCTSFFPEKTLGCYGDGGALFTDDEDLASAFRSIRVHGAMTRFHHDRIGLNARFDTLQAAVLLAKLPYLDEELERRRRIGARYNEWLRDVCAVPGTVPEGTHVFGQYTIRVSVDRDRLQRVLADEGIPTAVYYPKCLHEQPVFSEGRDRTGEYPVAEQAAREVLSLPMHPFLRAEDQQRVAETLITAVQG